VPSINDVAKLAGVSISTVSRTFSGPGTISILTQERVLEAARSLNYRPRATRTATKQRSVRGPGVGADTIGFQFFAATPEDSLACNTFYAPILAGVQLEANAIGWHVLVHTTDRHTFGQEMPRLLEEGAINGLLLVGGADPPVLAAFAERVSLIVLIDNYDYTMMYDSVVSDGFAGAYAATRHLIERGHRRIAFFSPEIEVAAFQERQRGYVCALIEAGIPFCSEFLYVFDSDNEDMSPREARLTELLTTAETAVTAIVGANDRHATFAMRICRRLGLRVPEEISIVGFDDVQESVHSDPPLTTVRVNKEALGRLAVRRLQARLEERERANGPILPIGRHELSVNLIVRESTARCPEPIISLP